MNSRVRSLIKKGLNRYSFTNRIFCIGLYKTGTTSLAILFANAGYRLAPQRVGEALVDNYLRGDKETILDWIATSRSQFFQDNPFSRPDTWRWLAEKFPDAYFILTKRSSTDVWYESVVRYHQKNLGMTNLSWEELEAFQSGGLPPGALARLRRAIVGDALDPFDRTLLTQHYEAHNNEVEQFFSSRSHRFLSLSLEAPDAIRQLNQFIRPVVPFRHMPHANRSR